MIGKIAFILLGPVQKDKYHWSYSGQSLKFTDAQQEIKKMRGELLSTPEALELIK